MEKCAAKRKDGKPCQNHPYQGGKYCYEHTRQQKRNLFLLISTIAGILAGIVGFVANFYAIFDFLGLPVPSFSPPLAATDLSPVSMCVPVVLPNDINPERDAARVWAQNLQPKGLQYASYAINDSNSSSSPSELQEQESFYLLENITNQVKGKEWIRVSNTVTLTVHVQPVPEHINILDAISLNCGGGGENREFPPVSLRSGSNQSTTNQYSSNTAFSEVDFFSLQPGEFESFLFTLTCSSPGIYSVEVDIPYSYSNRSGSATAKSERELVCPKSFTLWQNQDYKEILRVKDYTWDGTAYHALLPPGSEVGASSSTEASATSTQTSQLAPSGSISVFDFYANQVIGNITCAEVQQYPWLMYVPDYGSNWSFYYSPVYAKLYPDAKKGNNNETMVGFFNRDVYSICGMVPQTPPPPLSLITTEVAAAKDWQDTGMTVQEGERIGITYISGSWTFDRNIPVTDGIGTPGFSNAEAPVPSSNLGSLVARIGDGLPFLVGNHTSITSDRAGAIFLRINDTEGLDDNEGSITVEVKKLP